MKNISRLFLAIAVLVLWQRYGDSVMHRIDSSDPSKETSQAVSTPSPVVSSVENSQIATPTPSSTPLSEMMPSNSEIYLGTTSNFTELDGTTFKNATIKRFEADGIVISYSDGVVKLHCKDLPPEVCKKYGY